MGVGVGRGCGTAEVALLRRCQKVPLYQTKPVPANSKSLPLAKAEPISDISRACVVTYLRKFKTHYTAAMREKQPYGHQEKGGGGGPPGT